MTPNTQPASIARRLSGALVIAYALLSLVPFIWLFASAWQAAPTPTGATTAFSIQGYCDLFTTRQPQTPAYIASLPPARGWCEDLARQRQTVITGASDYWPRYAASLAIAAISGIACALLGTLAAFALTRPAMPLKRDWLGLMLVLRFLPPVALAVPLYVIYRELGLAGGSLGLVLVYTCLNLAFATWMLKGHIDAIPEGQAEMARMEGYTPLQSFFSVLVPQICTGILTTSLFCMIFAWNEFAFSALLAGPKAQTMPAFLSALRDANGVDWPALAAGTTLFILPVLALTLLLRKHLLRAISFGVLSE